MSDFKITIGADIAQAVTGLNTVQKSLASTAVAAAKTDSALQQFGKGSNQAAFALTNLGRVVQDAPFGFIGIANNINPLLESFQRLQKETGSTGSAFKALLSGVAGAGGLGLAVSIGTAALSLFGLAMQKSGTEAKKAESSIDDFGKTVQGIASKIAEQVTNVDVLVKAYQKENITQSERIAIIEKLKQVSPEYFNQLSNEKTSVDALTIAYRAYADSIDKSIISEIKRDKLKKLTERKIALSVDLNIIEPDTRLDALFNNIPKSATAATKQAQDIFRKNPFISKNIIGEQDKTLQSYIGRLNEVNKVNKEIFDLEVELAKLSVFKPEDADKKKKEAETVADVLAKLGREIEFLNSKELELGTNETKAKISAIEGAIQHLIRDLKVPRGSTVIEKLFGDITGLLPGLAQRVGDFNLKIKTSAEILIDQKQAQKEADDKIGKNPIIIKGRIDVGGADKDNDFVKALKEREKIIQASLDNLAVLSSQMVSDAFIGISEAVGKAFAAGDGIGGALAGAFESVLHLIGNYLIQLGKAAILTSTLGLAIKAAFSNPISGFVAGAAAIILGTVLNSIKLPAFAGGVQNFGGGLALVGERGPEIVNLPRGSDVIPNHRLNSLGTGTGVQVFIPETRISGADIVISYTRQQARNSRNS